MTGFGLAGHAWEMAERGQVVLQLTVDQPCRCIREPGRRRPPGLGTGGDARNRSYLAGRITGTVDEELEALVLDPQTSGGLLAAVSPADADRLTSAGWWDIGAVHAGLPAVVLTTGHSE